MKTIGRDLLAIVLATASVAFVNAQDSTTNTPAVTQEQFQQLHDQQQKQARQMHAMHNNVRNLGAAQTKQGSKIDSLDGAVNELKTGTTQAINDVKQEQKDSARAAQATMSTMQRWIIAIGGLALLCAFVIVLHLIYARRKAKQMITEQDVADMIDRKTPPIVREVIIRETVYVNSSVPELRAAWKKMREEFPNGPAFLSYAQRFQMDLAKGYDVEGYVGGYQVVFDDTKTIGDQTPKWYYEKQRIPFKELTQHGLRIVREREKANSVTAINVLENAMHGTELFRLMK